MQTGRYPDTITTMFAIVQIAGKQYKVAPDQTIVVDRIEAKSGETVTFDTVFLFFDGKTTKIGNPIIQGISVVAKVIEHGKGKKLHIRRFKSKVRYRRTKGFRPSQTTLKIITIS